jgi:hypothetical protein
LTSEDIHSAPSAAVQDLADAVKKLVEKITQQQVSKVSSQVEGYAKKIEALNLEVSRLNQEVKESEKKLLLSQSNSELQALEEENIELMKENKDLRKQLKCLKQNVPLVQTEDPVPAITAAAEASLPKISGTKRQFGTELKVNTESTSNTSKAQQDRESGDLKSVQLAQDENANIAGPKAKKIKVKSHQNTAKDCMVDGEQPGECNQS